MGPLLGGIKQCKCIEILRDFPCNNALFWVGNIMTPVWIGAEPVKKIARCIMLVCIRPRKFIWNPKNGGLVEMLFFFNEMIF